MSLSALLQHALGQDYPAEIEPEASGFFVYQVSYPNNPKAGGDTFYTKQDLDDWMNYADESGWVYEVRRYEVVVLVTGPFEMED